MNKWEQEDETAYLPPPPPTPPAPHPQAPQHAPELQLMGRGGGGGDGFEIWAVLPNVTVLCGMHCKSGVSACDCLCV